MKSVVKYETKFTISHKPPVLLLLGIAAAVALLLCSLTTVPAEEE